MQYKYRYMELAAELNISSAAVSKWERNLAGPSIEMLWALADFFDCSIDELVGRKSAQIESVRGYDEEMLRLAVIGEDLLKCSEVIAAHENLTCHFFKIFIYALDKNGNR